VLLFPDLEAIVIKAAGKTIPKPAIILAFKTIN
jgi:hypothetical protein